MKSLRAILDHPWLIWTLLALPALPVVATLLGDDPRAVHRMLHPTGEFSARFLVITLAITPLMMIWPQAPALRWLRARRRYLGVAAFAYAAGHVALYLIDKGGLALSAQELSRRAIWTGWLGFAVMIPIAATSFGGVVRWLGPDWKALQRWSYAAAALTFAHWALLRGGAAPALIHFAPLGALMFWRFAVRPRLRRAQGA